MVLIHIMTQDLDTPAAIHHFIRRFYDKVLSDEKLAPIFLQTANIDIEHHLSIIESFWRKLLLGEKDYDRHMMNIHRAVHQQGAFTPADFDRWLQHFEATLEEGYQGPFTDRARYLAHSIAAHLREALLAPDNFSHRTAPPTR